jgi:predicted MFS family arabinose efflux permease
MFFWAAVFLVVMLPLALFIKNSPQSAGYTPDGEPLNEADAADTAESAVSVEKAGSDLSGALKTRSFWVMSIAHLICGIGCGFVMTHIVIFATDLGYSDMIAASLVSVQGALNLAGVLVTGYLSDRIVRSRVLALTHFIRSLSFGVVVVFLLMGHGPTWMLYTAIGLFGFGWYTTAPLQAGLVADLFGNLRMGTILGLEISCHMFGMAVGAYFGGAVFEATGSYFIVFATQGLLELVAVALFMSIRQKKPVTAG